MLTPTELKQSLESASSSPLPFPSICDKSENAPLAKPAITIILIRAQDIHPLTAK